MRGNVVTLATVCAPYSSHDRALRVIKLRNVSISILFTRRFTIRILFLLPVSPTCISNFLSTTSLSSLSRV